MVAPHERGHEPRVLRNDDKMLAHLIDKYDVEIPLSDLFYSDIKATFKDDLLSAEYVAFVSWTGSSAISFPSRALASIGSFGMRLTRHEFPARR